MSATAYRKVSDLPETIAVFPLDGALLLPGAPLPLNIFEPRYLNMIDDALSGSRLIGMVQTKSGGAPQRPALQTVGCVGRLTSYAETDDERYLITLTGICRFRVAKEVEVNTPYRQVTADWSPFLVDLARPAPSSSDVRADLLSVLRQYLDRQNLSADWDSVTGAPADVLVNSLSMICPFSPAEKQVLLEAPDLQARRAALVGFMRMASAGPTEGSKGVH